MQVTLRRNNQEKILHARIIALHSAAMPQRKTTAGGDRAGCTGMQPGARGRAYPAHRHTWKAGAEHVYEGVSRLMRALRLLRRWWRGAAKRAGIGATGCA